MAYDRELADRIRETLTTEPDVTEKAMFGGLAFMVGGSMAVTASRGGAMMVHCEPEESEALIAEPGVERMVMRGRDMRGWLLVDASAISDDESLARWVEVGCRTVLG